MLSLLLTFATAMSTVQATPSAQPSSPQDPLALSLPKALSVALTQNPDLKRQQLGQAGAHANIEGQIGRFDAEVFSSFRLEQGASSTQGTQNMLATGFSRGSFDVGASKSFAVGTSIEASVAVVKSRNQITQPTSSEPRVVSVREYFVQPRLTIRQRLLQGAAASVNRAPIRRARAQALAASAGATGQELRTATEVALAYWDLKGAQLNLEACQRSKALVQEQIDLTKVVIQEGRRAPRELFALQQELSVKNIDLEDARNTLWARSADLYVQMGMIEDTQQLQALVASAPLAIPESVGHLDLAQAKASVAKHPELLALAATVEEKTADLRLALDKRKPQLDAYMAAGTRGLSRDSLNPDGMATSESGSWGKAMRSFFSQQGRPRLVDYSVEAGLEFRWNPRNRSAKAQGQTAQIELRRAQLALVSKRQRIRAGLLKAARMTSSLERRWQMAQESVHFAEQNLEVERDRFKAGYGTNDDLLLRMNELYRAQRRMAQINVSWMKSRVNYFALRGDLLAQLGVNPTP